jgi:hypothetical protein
MSWSVTAVGKAPAVRTAIADQFSKQSSCMEPEESVRQAAAVLLDAALAAQDSAVAVKVGASGSMSYKDWTTKAGVSNALSLSVEVLYGFVEATPPPPPNTPPEPTPAPEEPPKAMSA